MPDEENQRVRVLSSRIRELERILYSHVAGCVERNKQVDEMLRRLANLDESVHKFRGGWMAVSILGVLVLNVIQLLFASGILK